MYAGAPVGREILTGMEDSMSYDSLSMGVPDGRMSPDEPQQREDTLRCPSCKNEWAVVLYYDGTDADEDGVYPVWKPTDEKDMLCNRCGGKGE